MIADTKASFSSLAVELRRINTEVGVGRSAVGDGFVFAAEGGEIWVVNIIAVQDDDVRIHAEKVRFGI